MPRTASDNTVGGESGGKAAKRCRDRPLKRSRTIFMVAADSETTDTQVGKGSWPPDAPSKYTGGAVDKYYLM